MKVLNIESLVKKFGDLTAVNNINLQVEQGEIYGLLGPNGAGKSTTINMISALLNPSKGKIEIMGYDIGKETMKAKKNLGIVPQDIAVYESLTAFENVKFFASLYGLKGAELKSKSLEALEFVGLSDRMKDYPKNFSGGMKRRLNIACAIAHRPKLIIMDEPTVGIDPQSRNHILNSVRQLNKMGCTIIYTTHYMEEVEEICSKISIIDHGKVIAEGTKEELKEIVTDKNVVAVTVNSIEKVDEKELKRINGVVNVEVMDSTVEISSSKDVNNLDKLIIYFTEKNIPIRNVESKIPNLETVFLTLTGRKLRD
ncbi:MAG: ABC transporter ATP-binding protein [Bacillota bacterium]|nr:ABC transporter ATP-binding protein [Bacillota bacterium]